ncbi:MAG: uroporphyrinogen decarboxylase family protein [Chloroflexota bacterium]
MNQRDRVLAALQHNMPDRIPRFEIWIDALLDELGQDNVPSAHVNLGQDCVMMPSQTPAGSNAWQNGVDEWGRVWQDGMYINGVIDTETDLRQYSPPLDTAGQYFSENKVKAVSDLYPDHCLIYGTHNGPFMAGYMAMGFERFFIRLMDDPTFIHALLEYRTAWSIAIFQEAIRLGAEVIVMGDDAAYQSGSMISLPMWRKFALPYHRRIVNALNVPVIWHSDGDITSLLPMAVEAGFVGVHGLEPMAGMDLGEIKQEFGQDLVLIGNIDVNVLCKPDLAAVRSEVRRCVEQGTPNGGYMMATCNSIFDGMNAEAVAEMFRYQQEAGI